MWRTDDARYSDVQFLKFLPCITKYGFCRILTALKSSNKNTCKILDKLTKKVYCSDVETAAKAKIGDHLRVVSYWKNAPTIHNAWNEC